MRPHDERRNGDGSGADSSDSEPEEAWSLVDEAAPARALAALNALRLSRQHYDTVLEAGGAELPAHRAVLAAASPYLLEALGGAPGPHRVDVEAGALRALLQYAYTGRLEARDAAAARRLYRAAWRLRVEGARAALAERLVRRLAPLDALETRALPDLPARHVAALDAYIAERFDDLVAAGALAALPQLRVDLLRESSAHDGEETPAAVADAALLWLCSIPEAEFDLDELCTRTHLLYVDSCGALRDCGELPAARGDAHELQQYRREAAERGRRGPPGPAPLGARTPRDAGAVLAARAAGGGCTRALLALRGRLAAARVAWRAPGGAGAGVARGGALGGAEAGAGERRAALGCGRAAHGGAAAGGRLLVVGGYDRARVLSAAEAYDPWRNEWTPLAALREPRARFPAAVLGGALLALGGSDGHAELDSVHALQPHAGTWSARARLPLPLSHAAAAVDEQRQELYLVGGWSAGVNLKRVFKYSARDDVWTEAPPLNTGRSQCGAAFFEGSVWALGGCDAWHCLASTERLAVDAAGAGGAGAGGPAGAEGPAWLAGPALPTARRSVGCAAWRGRLVSAGGSDGGASLRRTDALARGSWLAGPSLRRARASLALVPLDDVLYAVAGFDGKEFLSCVECLYEPDGEWTTLCAPTSPARALPSPDEPAPATGPSAPATGPSAPATGPSAPATEPSAPATEPSAPATEPAAASEPHAGEPAPDE